MVTEIDLELRAVIMFGMEQGRLPRYDAGEAGKLEARRLFYVGLTRAREEVLTTDTSPANPFSCACGVWTRPCSRSCGTDTTSAAAAEIHRENAAYRGVNHERMKYDEWPIARFVDREFNHAPM